MGQLDVRVEFRFVLWFEKIILGIHIVHGYFGTEYLTATTCRPPLCQRGLVKTLTPQFPAQCVY